MSLYLVLQQSSCQGSAPQSSSIGRCVQEPEDGVELGVREPGGHCSGAGGPGRGQEAASEPEAETDPGEAGGQGPGVGQPGGEAGRGQTEAQHMAGTVTGGQARQQDLVLS